MPINWIDRNVLLPQDQSDVLAWGFVPMVLSATTKEMSKGTFIGVTKYERHSQRFTLDGSGHCGLVKVTHWAVIGDGPNQEAAPPSARPPEWDDKAAFTAHTPCTGCEWCEYAWGSHREWFS